MLKPAATNALLELLKPIQEDYAQSKEWQDIATKAYPPPEVKKKEKKVKDRGTRFPGGAKDVEAKPDGHVEGVTNGQIDSAKAQVDLSSGAEEAMKNLDIETNSIT